MHWRVRLLARILRGFYFGRIHIVGAADQPVPHRGGRLIVSSHRNGAIDGYIALGAFPGTQGLVSIQLLRHPLLRWMFDGIAVIRPKDRKRYGKHRAAFASPVDAALAHLRAGGDLMIFPEGTSEWGCKPLPYQRGAARIARAALSAGLPLEVVPLGLHYQAPDRFRSRVEALVGAPLELPAREADESERDWEHRIHQAIATALDAVSVNFPDLATFATAEAWATVQADNGQSYALSLVHAQQTPPSPSTLPPTRHRTWPWDGFVVGIFMLLAAPILLAGRYAGGKADARNTVSLFRIIGGSVTSLIWLPCLLLATWRWPLPMLVLGLLAVLGWWRWPRVMHGRER